MNSALLARKFIVALIFVSICKVALADSATLNNGGTTTNQQNIDEEGEFLTLLFMVNDDFDAEATTVAVQSLRLNEEPVMVDVAAATLSNLLTTGDENLLPDEFALHQNYPNPFNPVTTLRYDLPEDAMVNITIYDMMGRLVKTMVNTQQTAGYKSIQWNATNNAGRPVSAGLYLYTIQAGEFTQTKKMVLLK